MKKKVNLFVSRSLMLMFALVFVVASCKKETVEPIVDDPIVEDPIVEEPTPVVQEYYVNFFVWDDTYHVSDINLSIDGNNLGAVTKISSFSSIGDFFNENTLPDLILDLDGVYNLNVYHSINSELIATLNTGVILLEDDYEGNSLSWGVFDNGTGWEEVVFDRTLYGESIATSGVQIYQYITWGTTEPLEYINNRIIVLFALD
jgi:hypothetical protein